MKDQYDQYYFKSLAFLEIGKVAANNSDNTAAYDNAVAYQMYHALELFLKYAILKKSGDRKRTHDLKILFNQYNKLYPSSMYNIEHPFDFSKADANPKIEKLRQEHLDKYKLKSMGQHLKYPPGSDVGGYDFKIDASAFDEMKKKIVGLWEI